MASLFTNTIFYISASVYSSPYIIVIAGIVNLFAVWCQIYTTTQLLLPISSSASCFCSSSTTCHTSWATSCCRFYASRVPVTKMKTTLMNVLILTSGIKGGSCIPASSLFQLRHLKNSWCFTSRAPVLPQWHPSLCFGDFFKSCQLENAQQLH